MLTSPDAAAGHEEAAGDACVVCSSCPDLSPLSDAQIGVIATVFPSLLRAKSTSVLILFNLRLVSCTDLLAVLSPKICLEAKVSSSEPSTI